MWKGGRRLAYNLESLQAAWIMKMKGALIITFRCSLLQNTSLSCPMSEIILRRSVEW